MDGDERTGAALGMFQPGKTAGAGYSQPIGRWPANVVHDGSAEVVDAFPESNSQRSIVISTPSTVFGMGAHTGEYGFNDSGSAARFFFSAKADAEDRMTTTHPTTKPISLLRWLVRLVTPPGGTVLDPFGGSGTTAAACIRESFPCIIIEKEADYVAMIKQRLEHIQGADTPLFSALSHDEGLI